MLYSCAIRFFCKGKLPNVRIFRLFRIFRLIIFELDFFNYYKEMETKTEQISSYEQQLANESIGVLSRVSESIVGYGGDSVKLVFQESREIVSIPPKAFELFFELIQNMAKGKSVTILTSDAEISTQQAADFLKVSRPYVVKLLENKVLPFKKVGRHRRVLLRDLIEYENSMKAKREETLDELTQVSQELNLGYE